MISTVELKRAGGQNRKGFLLNNSKDNDMKNQICKDNVPIRNIQLKEISLSYERFRLIRPGAYSSMENSMRQYGQITPVVVCQLNKKKRDCYEIIDGFKRFHSAKLLKFSHLECRILQLNSHTLKAAIVHLNHAFGSICALEEGMILNSLYREDGLQQQEIAVLFGRHKSWVCRRIALTEHLCEEVIEHFRLGLIGVGIGRELSRLPRGNQGAVLKSVLKHHLCCRETGQLVDLVSTRPRWEHESILRFPATILEARTPPRPSNPEKVDGKLEQGIDFILKGGQCIEDTIKHPGAAPFSASQSATLLQSLVSAQEQLDRIRIMIKEPLHADKVH